MRIALYNLLLLAFHVRAFRRLRAAPSLLTAVGAVFELTLLGGGLAALLSEGNTFKAIGLLAWGVFVHGPLLLIGGALVVRSSTRSAAAMGLGAGVVIVAAGIYAFRLEPFRLQVSRHEILAEELSERIRLVLIADLQTDRVGAYERAALERAKSLSPDLILFSGDYLQIRDPAERRDARAEMRAVFAAVGLDAPLGAVAVAGNVDDAGWPQLFEDLPVRSVESTTTAAFGPLQLTALGLRDSFNPELRVPGAAAFHVVVGHAPDYALGDVDADLLLAGHTHGGQVQLPFIGPLWTLSEVPRAWASGRTAHPGGGTLIVSRGVGMERGDAPRLRFLCPPELVVIDLVPR